MSDNDRDYDEKASDEEAQRGLFAGDEEERFYDATDGNEEAVAGQQVDGMESGEVIPQCEGCSRDEGEPEGQPKNLWAKEACGVAKGGGAY